ncbi:TIGR04222 domain-containing membrane protein [Streptomyces sp. NPDC012794]|uniref:TIGR04222 domain-containing membrane protein n=1 Tax=Streptomyces sp. NPDC012794 TaxID=3364850 RepID=UPI0036AE0254
MNTLAVAVWAAVTVSTLLLLRALRRSRPPVPGPAPAVHDLSEAAFLAGGPGTVVDTALVSLLGDGRLVVGGPGIVQARPGARGTDPVERAVLLALSRAPSGWLYQVRYAAMCEPAVQETGDALAARGLLSAPGAGRGARRWGLAQAVVCLVMLPLSLPLTFIFLLADPEPGVPFALVVLPALLGGLVAGLVCARRAGRRITPAGRRALAAFRERYAADPAPRVRTALFGLRGLPDPYLRGQLVPAARGTRLAAAQSRGRGTGSAGTSGAWAEPLPVLWCAMSDGGGGSSGAGGCGASGSGCSGGSGHGCSGGSGGSGSSCSGGSGSSCSGGSSCGGSSGSSCSSSS